MNACLQNLHAYAQHMFKSGEVLVSNGSATFPAIALMIDAGEHFLCDLIGTAHKPVKLHARRSKAPSASIYLSQFFDSAPHATYVVADRQTLANVVISGSRAAQEAAYRLNLDITGRSVLYSETEGDIDALHFSPSTRSAIFDNCLFVSKRKGLFRAKYTAYCHVASPLMTEGELVGEIRRHVLRSMQPAANISPPTIPGLSLHEPLHGEHRHISAEFANLFLSPQHRETTIGKFLNDHPQVLVRAFDAVSFLHEPTLAWKGMKMQSDTASIRPDFMLQRADGFWDIVDLKTAALRRRALTKGRPTRRRFIDYVYEGIAQLRNYERYFSDPANAAYAHARHKIKVKNPRLILIIGNRENASAEEVEAALSSHPDNVLIVDYDTLNAMYFARRN